MSDLIQNIKDIYAAFGRGEIATILASLTDDVSWEFEAPAELSWSGIRQTPQEAAGFFAGIAAEHVNPKLWRERNHIRLIEQHAQTAGMPFKQGF